MRLLAGASGYSFKEWKGDFYPQDIQPGAMLSWYAARLSTVEINNTFYRMPKGEVLRNWANATPDHFRFAIKAPRRITHLARLKADSAGDSLDYLYRALGELGEKRGPVLFQLPPFLKRDLPRLRDFLARLPEPRSAAFEFRDATWLVEETFSLLRDAGAALCVSEREDALPPPLVKTTDWGYVRLRLERYSDADLRAWAERLRSTGWREIFVFFMHEPTAPAYARKLTELSS